MLTILTTTSTKDKVEAIINSVDQLSELVSVTLSTSETNPTHKLLYVDQTVKPALEWNDTEPPYLIPEQEFNQSHLLALVFYKLGNHQRALELSESFESLHHHLLIATSLQYGYAITQEMLDFTSEIPHNLAILNHYGSLNFEPKNSIDKYYTYALEHAQNDEEATFTAKHYGAYLLDKSNFKTAENLATEYAKKGISKEAQNAMAQLLSQALMHQLQIPYDSKKLEKTFELQNACIAFYEERSLFINAGLLLMDAAETAGYKGDYPTANTLINKAIHYFKEEQITEFMGEASLKKATLLYAWSKNGNPQYYKPAINAFQDSLKIFKKHNTPEKYGEIQHKLALIYSEIPVSPEEKPIWTAFCASAFKEALEIYSEEKHPYEFAMVCHNYATALINFPEAKLHNNLSKAFDLFENALKIRTAKAYPIERSLSLLNQVELLWQMHNADKDEEEKHFHLMQQKANEVLQLTSEQHLIERAQEHLNALNNLKITLN